MKHNKDRSDFLKRLAEARRQHCFPTDLRPRAQDFIHRLLTLLFPHFAEGEDCSEARVGADLDAVSSALTAIVKRLNADASVVQPFIDALPSVWEALREDAQAICDGDPAARSVDEVILAYPGFHATACHRVAHILHENGLAVVPRLVSELAHERTGVDIHPGATIGRRFVIDHGTGVVIGETAVIGDGVKLYQGVTLGALTVEKGSSDKKRHPTIGDRVVIYANATILGGDTHIGHDSVIAGNAFITESVPPFSRVGRS